MNVAVMAYSFNPSWQDGRINIFGYLESCKYRYGVQTADLWNRMLESTEEAYLRKVKRELDARDLTVVNLAIDGAHLWTDEPAQREQHHRYALAQLAAAETLGATTVRIDAGGAREADTFDDAQLAFVMRRYREYAQRAYDNGYRVGPENHWGPSLHPETLRTICEMVDHPGFGILLHVDRWRGAGADRGNELLAPWTMHTHWDQTAIDRELDAKVQLLMDQNYTGCWSIEQAAEDYDEIGALLERLRQALAKCSS